jgi:hypothetical protein
MLNVFSPSISIKLKIFVNIKYLFDSNIIVKVKYIFAQKSLLKLKLFSLNIFVKA